MASTRNGRFQTMPSGVPLTETSARFLTSPRSSQSLRPPPNHSLGASTVRVGRRGSRKVLHARVGIVGPGLEVVERDRVGRAAVLLKGTVHGPDTVASDRSTAGGNVRDGGALAGLPEHDKHRVPRIEMERHGRAIARYVDTRRLAHAGVGVPDSGVDPLTRKVASIASPRSCRLLT